MYLVAQIPFRSPFRSPFRYLKLLGVTVWMGLKLFLDAPLPRIFKGLN